MSVSSHKPIQNSRPILYSRPTHRAHLLNKQIQRLKALALLGLACRRNSPKPLESESHGQGGEK